MRPSTIIGGHALSALARERTIALIALASALYLARISHIDPEMAEEQLSITYGHFSVPWLSRAWPMDVTWEAMEG